MKRRIVQTLAPALLLPGLLLALFMFHNDSLGDHYSRIAPYNHPVFNRSSSLLKEITIEESRLKTDPEGPFVLTSLAGLYAKQGKNTGNFALLDHADQLARKSESILSFFNDGALLVQADVAQARHEFPKAVKICENVVSNKFSRRGSKIDALSTLVTSQLATGNISEASRNADRLLHLRPAVGNYVLRALVMTAQGKSPDALQDFQTAYQKEAFGDPAGSALLRVFWGRFYLKQGRLTEAQDLFHEALRILPNDPQALGLLAELEVRKGKLSDAEAHYTEAFSFSRQMVYLLGEARVKRLKGQTREADEIRDEAIRVIEREIIGSGYGHRFELARLLLERHRPEDLQHALQLAEKETHLRSSPEILEVHAWALLENHRPLEAREEIQKALRTGVQDAEIYHRAGLIESAMHNPTQAHFYTRRSHEIDPTFNPTAS